MAQEDWRPLGYEGDEAATYDALHEGVPKWMSTSFWDWVTKAFTVRMTRAGYSGYRDVFASELLRMAERVLRFSTAYGGGDVSRGVNALHTTISEAGLELRLADFLLSVGKDRGPLEKTLRESGSAWKVGVRSGKPGLVRRVPEGVQDHTDAVISRSGRAGKRLAEAWADAFGINPDPPSAYTLAVKAVEDAAIPVVVPNQREATLGHVIGQLKTDGDWRLPLTREDSDAPTASIVLRMCQALWKGHHDRHGGGSHTVPEVTQDEAETAVTIAVPLVHWFASGMVARRRP
jgi:hypothetical protein